MKLQTMFRGRRKAGMLRKLRKRSKGMKKDESMMSLRTDISSDASTAFPDPADLESVILCSKQDLEGVEEEHQEAAIEEESSKVGMELSTQIRNEEEQTTSIDMMIHMMNSFLCVEEATLPQLAEAGMESIAESSHRQDDESMREAIIQESVECIYSDSSEMARIEPAVEMNMLHSSSTRTCNSYTLPPLDPKSWPQAPLLFRAAPNSGTEILGIRRDDSKEYLWTPESNIRWWNLLDNTIRKDDEQKEQPDKGCWMLPINDGTEAVGKSLVTDFESKLFKGSLLIRLRDAPDPTGSPSSTTKDQGFFVNNHGIRYQVTIQGKFKRSLQWSNLLTGLRLRRKFGKAPPKWFLWTALKIVQFFAPQLQTKLDGDRPYALSPLGSAPRTVTINRGETADLLGVDREEPTINEESLTGKAYPVQDPLERARARKKDFDHKFKANDPSFCTGVRDTFTFQFLQHLLDYHTSSIDLGSFHHDMNDILGGQPFQVMAEHDGEPLWMFEIWNENILEDAKRELEKRRGKTAQNFD